MNPRAFANRFCSRPIWGASLIALVATLAMAGQGSFHAPPRYDGAGYAVLAGRWRKEAVTGPSIIPIAPGTPIFRPVILCFLRWCGASPGPRPPLRTLPHVLCAIGATLAAFFWFRRDLPAGCRAGARAGPGGQLGSWARAATGIQSEPLYELLGQLTILAACRWRRPGRHRSVFDPGRSSGRLLSDPASGHRPGDRGDARSRAAEAAMAGGCRRRDRNGAGRAWLGWLLVVGASQRTQANMLIAGSPGLLARFVSQVAFYVQRIPDQITGPFVEIATVIHPSKDAAAVAYSGPSRPLRPCLAAGSSRFASPGAGLRV